jgi:hypothetical protein
MSIFDYLRGIGGETVANGGVPPVPPKKPQFMGFGMQQEQAAPDNRMRNATLAGFGNMLSNLGQSTGERVELRNASGALLGGTPENIPTWQEALQSGVQGIGEMQQQAMQEAEKQSMRQAAQQYAQNIQDPQLRSLLMGMGPEAVLQFMQKEQAAKQAMDLQRMQDAAAMGRTQATISGQERISRIENPMIPTAGMFGGGQMPALQDIDAEIARRSAASAQVAAPQSSQFSIDDFLSQRRGF